MNHKKLYNGVQMPMLGYGTLHIPPEITERCVSDALEAGYRLIDTAAAYMNEQEIGSAIQKAGIPRSDLFVTSKLWVQDSGYEHTLQAFDTSLQKLGLDYLDLYLIHHPFHDYYGSWRAMEQLYQQGRIRAIGVCNFAMDRFVDLWMNANVKPMINQMEFHPFYQQKEALPLLKKYECQLQAWGPLNEGQRNIFQHEVLSSIAQKYNKTVAQITLRWHIQQDVIAIPKTIHKERMEENIAIWNFTLDKEDMMKINALDFGYSEIIDHRCYQSAKRLNTWKIHE